MGHSHSFTAPPSRLIGCHATPQAHAKFTRPSPSIPTQEVITATFRPQYDTEIPVQWTVNLTRIQEIRYV